MTPPVEVPSAVPSASRNWIRLALYLIIAAGCALRVYEALEHNPMDHIFSDTQRHWDHAKEPLTPSPMAMFDQPVYQIWVSVVQKVTTGIPLLVGLYAAALSVLTPWCWYRFLRETPVSKNVALGAWAVLGLMPSWIGIYSYFMSETLFLPALGVSLWATMRADRRRTVGTYVAMVAWWTFCGLTRGIGIPMAAVAALWVWWRHPEKLRTAVASALLLAAALGPVAYRNHYHFKFWAPHGMGWLNKTYAESGARVIEMELYRDGAVWGYGFGSPSIDSRPFEPFSDWTSKRDNTVRIHIDFANGTRDWKKEFERTAVRDRGRRWQLHVENAVFLFFGNSWPDNNEAYAMGRAANLSRWIWAPVFLVMIVWVGLRFGTVLRHPLLPLVTGAWLFFQGWMLMVPNEGRYRKPFEGLAVAQVALLAGLPRRRGESGPPAAPAPAVAEPVVTATGSAEPSRPAVAEPPSAGIASPPSVPSA